LKCSFSIADAELKEKFQDSATSEGLKVTVLTIPSKSWSIWKVHEVPPSASNYMIRRAKQLVMDQDIMSSPNPKPDKTLNEVTVEVVKSFCSSDEVSGVMPGKKDYCIFSNTLRTFFPKKLRPKSGVRGLFANYKVGKDLFTPRLARQGEERAFMLWCECASTLLTVNALSKLSLFLPRAKRSQQTSE
jgi:hypothetical protein